MLDQKIIKKFSNVLKKEGMKMTNQRLIILEEIVKNTKLKFIKNITVTIQKEVAERIVAKSGSKSFGRLSLIMDLLSSSELLFDIYRR